MPNTTFHSPLARSGVGFGHTAGQIWGFVAALGLALQVRKERHLLGTLDERTLKDLGFNRGDAYAEAHRSFWDLPVDRLRG